MKNPNSARPRTRTFSANTIRFASLILVVMTIIALGAVAYFTERGIIASRDSVIHTYQIGRERLAEFRGQINVESSSAGSVIEAVIPTGASMETKDNPEQAVQA